MDEKLDIITIGESLIELSSDTSLSSTECLHKYYGGDALTTAIAALRLGSRVGFITRVGNDVFKDYLLDSWQAEGLDISQVKIANDPNGVYFIASSKKKKKEASYYRKKIAPAKLSLDDISQEYIESSKIVYASGTTLSLSISTEEAVIKAFQIAKEKNLTTAFDPNYSARFTTPEVAKEQFAKISPYTDILFLSDKYDTSNIFELDSVENIIKNLWDRGIGTVIIKSTIKQGYYTGYNGNIYFSEFYSKNPVDTTCAGDAFNGGYLHGITHGLTPVESVKLASVVAGLQTQSIGAIKSIPYKDEVYSILKGAC